MAEQHGHHANVMEQYERAYPKFRFVGPSPIDFDKKLAFDQCVWNDLCNMDVAQLIQNNTEVVGMIFNLDPHNKDGSHWVSMYFNVPRGELYYFDSGGREDSEARSTGSVRTSSRRRESSVGR